MTLRLVLCHTCVRGAPDGGGEGVAPSAPPAAVIDGLEGGGASSTEGAVRGGDDWWRKVR